MNTQTIMVQIADREWTLEALHAACLLARNTSAKIALVQMIPVQHPNWLGTDWGYLNVTAEEKDAFEDYQATIEDYGLECVPTLFQYATWAEGTLQAAEHVDAQTVFAPKPHSLLPIWTRFQVWMMQHRFTQQGRKWIASPLYGPKAEINEGELAPQQASV
jgi:hypothetical protein